MNFLLDPNISYLILVAGFVMAVLALFSPGTGLLEAGAVVAIIFAGYSVANLPINWWALAILVIGVFPFLFALRKSQKLVYLAISIVALVIGSIFMFRLESGGPAVNPYLAGVVSVLVIGFMWIVAARGIEAMQLKPLNRLGNLENQIGKTRSDVYLTGTVYIQNEEWSARSKQPIPADTLVKVIRKDGFTVEVEPLSDENGSADLLRE
ncbi:MAG: hypothetical protein GX577_10575 [Leptolinea sp.]|nr:hypothetical protein [Leptolinea sp.]